MALALVLLFLTIAILVIGCSEPKTIPQILAANDTAKAILQPGLANASVNSSTNVTSTLKLSRYPVISFDIAIDSVRNFVGNPDVCVTIQCTFPTYYGVAYSLLSGGDFFAVNALTGEVDYADFISYPVGNFSQGNVIDIETGRSLAEAFARKHYPGFDVAKMNFMGSRLRQDENGGYFYNYEWREVIDNVNGLNDVIVTVWAGNGKIRTYHAIHAPADAGASFTISRGNAVLIAVSSIGNITKNFTVSSDPVQWNFNVLYRFAFPDQNGNWYGSYHLSIADVHPGLFMDEKWQQHVVWDVLMSMRREARANETYAFGETLFYRIDVDAGNGTVLRTVHSRSMGPANWPA